MTTTKAVGTNAPQAVAAGTKAIDLKLNTAANIAQLPVTTDKTDPQGWTLGNDLISTMLRNQTLLLEINELQQRLASKVLDPQKDGKVADPFAPKPLTAEELKTQQQTLENTRKQLLALKAQDVENARKAIVNVDKTLSSFGVPASPTTAIGQYPALKPLG